MSDLPFNIPFPIPMGATSISGNSATFRVEYKGQLHQIIINIRENPKIFNLSHIIEPDFLDKSLHQSVEGEWFIETNEGGIAAPTGVLLPKMVRKIFKVPLFNRLFHTTTLMKVTSDHQHVKDYLASERAWDKKTY